MHTGSDWKIPVCIQGLHYNPRMHTGITCHAIPVYIRGLILTPICMRGFDRSPNAYRDWYEMISKLGVIKPKANGEQYPKCGVLSDIPERKWGAIISRNANGERATQNILWCTKQYVLCEWCFLILVGAHSHPKNSGSTHDSAKDRWQVNDTSETGPRMHTGSPRMHTGSKTEKFANGETHYRRTRGRSLTSLSSFARKFHRTYHKYLYFYFIPTWRVILTTVNGFLFTRRFRR